MHVELAQARQARHYHGIARWHARQGQQSRGAGQSGYIEVVIGRETVANQQGKSLHRGRCRCACDVGVQYRLPVVDRIELPLKQASALMWPDTARACSLALASSRGSVVIGVRRACASAPVFAASRHLSTPTATGAGTAAPARRPRVGASAVRGTAAKGPQLPATRIRP